MKKNSSKLRLVALMLAVIMVVALCGCGTGKGSAEKSNAGMSSGGPGSAEPGSADKSNMGESSTDTGKEATLDIGLLIHTTEWFATVDMTNNYEFNAMVAYINDELGGWKIGDTTYKIKTVQMDGASDNDALRNGAIALVDAGVKFVVETNDFWVINCEDVFEDAGVMHTCAYCVYIPGYISPENPMAFTASNGTIGDYTTAFNVLKEVYPDVKKILYVENDNGNNAITFDKVKEIGGAMGFEVLEQNVLYPGDTTDYSSVALQIVQSGADCFFGNGSPDAYGAILKEVRAQGSDMVCACIQGKPATMLMEYAGKEASYNAFTLGPSTRESDKDKNTDILNGVVAKVRELYGDEAAASFDGAACNNLYVMLQAMQKAGSTDPQEVAKAWENMGTVETIYGTGYTGGELTYGNPNHAIGSPRSVSILDPTAEDGWYFWGWMETKIP